MLFLWVVSIVYFLVKQVFRLVRMSVAPALCAAIVYMIWSDKPLQIHIGSAALVEHTAELVTYDLQDSLMVLSAGTATSLPKATPIATTPDMHSSSHTPTHDDVTPDIGLVKAAPMEVHRARKTGATAPTSQRTHYESTPSPATYISSSPGADSPRLQYIRRFAPVARKEMELYGIPASITLAQGLLESSVGRSELAKVCNNHFGIKCHQRHCKKGHCRNFEDDSHKDFFKQYATVWESYRDHSKHLTGERYRGLQAHGKDYRKWAHGLKAAGYATDPLYAQKLIRAIERYRLYQYDQ